MIKKILLLLFITITSIFSSEECKNYKAESGVVKYVLSYNTISNLSCESYKISLDTVNTLIKRMDAIVTNGKDIDSSNSNEIVQKISLIYKDSDMKKLSDTNNLISEYSFSSNITGVNIIKKEATIGSVFGTYDSASWKGKLWSYYISKKEGNNNLVFEEINIKNFYIDMLTNYIYQKKQDPFFIYNQLFYIGANMSQVKNPNEKSAAGAVKFYKNLKEAAIDLNDKNAIKKYIETAFSKLFPFIAPQEGENKRILKNLSIKPNDSKIANHETYTATAAASVTLIPETLDENTFVLPFRSAGNHDETFSKQLFMQIASDYMQEKNLKDGTIIFSNMTDLKFETKQWQTGKRIKTSHLSEEANTRRYIEGVYKLVPASDIGNVESSFSFLSPNIKILNFAPHINTNDKYNISGIGHTMQYYAMLIDKKQLEANGFNLNDDKEGKQEKNYHDYKQEEKKGPDIFLMVVIIIIAIVLTVVSCGSSTPLLVFIFSQYMAITIAAAVVVGALMQMSTSGPDMGGSDAAITLAQSKTSADVDKKQFFHTDLLSNPDGNYSADNDKTIAKTPILLNLEFLSKNTKLFKKEGTKMFAKDNNSQNVESVSEFLYYNDNTFYSPFHIKSNFSKKFISFAKYNLLNLLSDNNSMYKYKELPMQYENPLEKDSETLKIISHVLLKEVPIIVKPTEIQPTNLNFKVEDIIKIINVNGVKEPKVMQKIYFKKIELRMLPIENTKPPNQYFCINSNFEKLEADISGDTFYAFSPTDKKNSLIKDYEINKKKIINFSFTKRNNCNNVDYIFSFEDNLGRKKIAYIRIKDNN